MRLRLPHFHDDPDWQADLHAYYECRCGARRTRRLYSNIDGPERPGWPRLSDRHGMPINDTGWVVEQ